MNNLPGLENLQKFLVLAEDQNFRRTSERLHLTNRR
jgi:DNA-binding transcriptional LysR family regulator